MVREVVVIEAQLVQAGRCRKSPEGTGQVLTHSLPWAHCPAVKGIVGLAVPTQGHGG